MDAEKISDATEYPLACLTECEREEPTMKFLDSFTEQAYALLRIVAGLLFLAHGVQ